MKKVFALGSARAHTCSPKTPKSMSLYILINLLTKFYLCYIRYRHRRRHSLCPHSIKRTVISKIILAIIRFATHSRRLKKYMQKHCDYSQDMHRAREPVDTNSLRSWQRSHTVMRRHCYHISLLSYCNA